MKWFASSLAAGCILATGCGTWISVRHAGLDDSSLGGIAVNQRGYYKVKVESSPAAFNVKAQPGKVVAIDPQRVTTVNWKRLPFSSGDLTIKLTPEQTLKEATISGSTGAVRATQAATAGVKAFSGAEGE